MKAPFTWFASVCTFFLFASSLAIYLSKGAEYTQTDIVFILGNSILTGLGAAWTGPRFVKVMRGNENDDSTD